MQHCAFIYLCLEVKTVFLTPKYSPLKRPTGYNSFQYKAESNNDYVIEFNVTINNKTGLLWEEFNASWAGQSWSKV